MITTLKFVGPMWTILLVATIAILGIAVLGAASEVAPAIENLVVNANGRLTDVDTSTSHAEKKHGVELTNNIRHCIDNGGYIQTWQLDKRFIEVCVLNDENGDPNDEHFGLRVCRDDPKCGFVEITAFDKTGMINNVEQYLENHGYVDVTVR